MTDTPPALPFLNKATFAAAIDHFINHLQTYTSLEYELKYSPFDESDVYLVIKKFISAPAAAEQSSPTQPSEPAIDLDDIEIEDDDPESLTLQDLASPPTDPSPPTHQVHYHILLSPIYSVPVLYFNIHPLSPSPQPPIHTLDAIYTLLVPPPTRSHAALSLESTGIQGGISQSHHPILQTAWWFVHPCNTADALREWGGDLTVERYLSVWIGLVGAVVGLELKVGAGSSVVYE
ncbi:hypothetical protein ABW19_dt0209927 [Dactylella cylindrospora]|nr:hypothetical protein ABW19_dt0209927 [Dactylella cylindrospora]